jgi:hypothetical protein
MKPPRVIHALAVKRAELAAELSHHETRAEYCRQGIATIDAALALWEQGGDAPNLKRRYKAKPTVVPKLVRHITDALRIASEPITARQIIETISAGMDLEQAEYVRLRASVYWRLRDMRKEGRVASDTGADRKVRWGLRDAMELVVAERS